MKFTPNQKEIAQTLIEFALILPIFLLMLMLIFDLGRSVYAYSVIHNAAREGARSGIIWPYNQGQADAVARHLTAGLDPTQIGVITIPPSITNPDTFEVRVSYTFTAVTPLLGQLLGSPGKTITLLARSTMLIEK